EASCPKGGVQPARGQELALFQRFNNRLELVFLWTPCRLTAFAQGLCFSLARRLPPIESHGERSSWTVPATRDDLGLLSHYPNIDHNSARRIESGSLDRKGLVPGRESR